MTTNSEYGPVTPIRKAPGIPKPGLGLDTSTGMGGAPVKPPYPVNPPAKPPYPVNPPAKPPYPVPGVPPKPPYPENGALPTTPQPTPPGTATQPPGTAPGAPVTPGTGQPPTGAPPTPGSLGLDFMRQVTPNELVANQLNSLLDQNGAYMRNARLRGQEQAANRGLLNSSVAAGASQRAALEAAAPIAQADAEVYRQANQGNFESLSQLRQMRTAADLENWLSSESYNREFNGNLAMLPIQSSMDMLAYIQQRAMEDPAVYTPDVISGMNNFFNYNMFDIMNSFFGTGDGGG